MIYRYARKIDLHIYTVHRRLKSYIWSYNYDSMNINILINLKYITIYVPRRMKAMCITLKNHTTVWEPWQLHKYNYTYIYRHLCKKSGALAL